MIKQHKGSTLEASMRKIDAADVEQYRESGEWRDRTYLDDFLDQVLRQPDKIAIVTYRLGEAEPTTVTYRELGAYVDHIAGQLITRGVMPADVVTVQVPNGWEGPAICLAVLRVGAVPNPIPINYHEREVRFMIGHAGSKIYFVPSKFRGYDFGEVAIRLRDEIESLESVFILNGGPEVDPSTDFDANFLSDVTPPSSDLLSALESRRPSADDIAVLVYTSGTTGTPKAALHTHNTAWSGYYHTMVRALALTNDDVVFMASTIGHLTGYLHGVLSPLSLGQKIVYQDIWDADGLLNILDSEGITWTVSATTFALDMIDAQRRQKRPSHTLRAFACGGAAIPPIVATTFSEWFSASLVPLWGCSESGIATIHQLGASVETLSSSDGYQVPWQKLRIVSDEGDVVKQGDVGELQVIGPGLFVGYFDQPELTEDCMTGDGWFHTGDLALEREDGTIRIAGRSKDIIIRGGQNIPVVEIEAVLASHPKVQDIAVVSYPDDRLGERVCAVVVPAENEPSFDELIDYLRDAGMAKIFWPQKLVVVKEFPRTPSGKIQKFKLREQLAEDLATSVE